MQQHDAHEFMTAVLERMKEEACEARLDGSPPSSVNGASVIKSAFEGLVQKKVSFIVSTLMNCAILTLLHSYLALSVNLPQPPMKGFSTYPWPSSDLQQKTRRSSLVLTTMLLLKK